MSMESMGSGKPLVDVLVEFLAASPLPTPEVVREMQARYPEYGDEILDCARTMVDVVLSPEFEAGFAPDPADEPSVHRLAAVLTAPPPRVRETLVEAIGALGMSVEDMAAATGAPSELLRPLVEGGVRPPIARPMLERLASVLGRSVDEARALVNASFARPALGHASSRGVPLRRIRSYAEVLEASGVPEDRKSDWLDG